MAAHCHHGSNVRNMYGYEFFKRINQFCRKLCGRVDISRAFKLTSVLGYFFHTVFCFSPAFTGFVELCRSELELEEVGKDVEVNLIFLKKSLRHCLIPAGS